MTIGIIVRHVDSHRRGRKHFTMLHCQQNLPLASLEKLEHRILTSSDRAVVINGKDFIARFDASVDESRLILHHLLHVHAHLVRRLLDEQAQPASRRFDQFYFLHVCNR